jgi:hypothetical protein
MIDLVVLLGFTISQVYKLFTEVWYADVLNAERGGADFLGFMPTATYVANANRIESFVTLGAMLKMAKYLELIHGANIINRLFTSSLAELIFAMIHFMLVGYGFVTVANMIFGQYSKDFFDTYTAFISCAEISLGKVDTSRWDEYFAIAPIAGPAFLLFFIIFIYYGVGQLFLAVLCNKFTVQRERRDREEDDEAEYDRMIEEYELSHGVQRVPVSLFEQLTHYIGEKLGMVETAGQKVRARIDRLMIAVGIDPYKDIDMSESYNQMSRRMTGAMGGRGAQSDGGVELTSEG